MKIRWIAFVAAAFALSACSGHNDAPVPSPASTSVATTPSVTPVTPQDAATVTPEENPYELNTPTAADNSVAWNQLMTDATEKITAKFGLNDITQGDVQITRNDGGTRVIMMKLKGKAGQVEIYPQGTGVDPYVYYTSGSGEPNLAIMRGGDNGFASSSTEARQRSETAFKLARELCDELLPPK